MRRGDRLAAVGAAIVGDDDLAARPNRSAIIASASLALAMQTGRQAASLRQGMTMLTSTGRARDRAKLLEGFVPHRSLPRWTRPR